VHVALVAKDVAQERVIASQRRAEKDTAVNTKLLNMIIFTNQNNQNNPNEQDDLV
jgi:hypothetical protein